MSPQARCCEERGGNETRTRLQSAAQHQEVAEKSSLQTDCIQNEGTGANRCRRSLESVK